jgi:hypothetical protein
MTKMKKIPANNKRTLSGWQDPAMSPYCSIFSKVRSFGKDYRQFAFFGTKNKGKVVRLYCNISVKN